MTQTDPSDLALTYGSSYLVFERPAKSIKVHEATCPLSHPCHNIDAETIARFRLLVSKIKYRDWNIDLRERVGTASIEVEAKVIDLITGKPSSNYGPKHFLCPNMSNEFILDLIFNAIKEVELHEIAEHFYFDDVQVHCPHGPSGEVI